jgi:hypothetical protein
MEKLKLEKRKNLKNLKQHKEDIISEILNSNNLEINNTIHTEIEYSIWERIKKTLGID